MLNDLGLTDKNATAGCACGCGGHEQSAKAKETDAAASAQPTVVTATQQDSAQQDATQQNPVQPTTTELQITGMTCGHCVSSVTEELSAIDGVESVQVQLNAGGVSTVTVASNASLSPDAVRAAIDEAGYSLADA
ncbi:heavy-metal-associated domain-containing protein [Diaminobutyricimonas sp. LJ205]|uniref:heavy-metal-associated domain-containing protein n=1 Tax=Diaminobutyricimonas sp. LJ205 TaxID=2683590 RepID=UPI0012F48880|nr:heavy-metal-associated domain-containing protein [Diaminobutyricimonas sp. LJ205]